MARMLQVIRRKNIAINTPMPIAKMMSFSFDALQIITFGMFKNVIITRDQVTQLMVDNVVTTDFGSFEDFKIRPKSMDAVLETYLYRYRPYGQYTSIHESADSN